MSTIPDGFCQCGCGQRTAIAAVNRPSLGWVKGEPIRFVQHHNRGCGEVPVEPVQAAFKASGITAEELARRLGWLWAGEPDSTRVRRRLGLTSYMSRGRFGRNRWMSYRTAVQIAEALNIDPHQVGV